MGDPEPRLCPPFVTVTEVFEPPAKRVAPSETVLMLVLIANEDKTTCGLVVVRMPNVRNGVGACAKYPSVFKMFTAMSAVYLGSERCIWTALGVLRDASVVHGELDGGRVTLHINIRAPVTCSSRRDYAPQLGYIARVVDGVTQQEVRSYAPFSELFDGHATRAALTIGRTFEVRQCNCENPQTIFTCVFA